MKHVEAAGTFSTQAAVRSYESGPDGLMKPETVLHWLQEIAEAHASALGFGYDFVMSRGLAWVEVRLDMTIGRRPAWKEVVELRTCTARPPLFRRAAIWKSGMRRVTALSRQAASGPSSTSAAGAPFP